MSEALLSISFRNRSLLYTVLQEIVDRASELDLHASEQEFVQGLIDQFDEVFSDSYDTRAELYIERSETKPAKAVRNYPVKPAVRKKTKKSHK